VFPCHEPTPCGCSCRRPDCSSPAKHPRTRKGFRDATTDPETIARWWRQWPTANVALCTGGDSGLVVLDVDPGTAACALWPNSSAATAPSRRASRFTPEAAVAITGSPTPAGTSTTQRRPPRTRDRRPGRRLATSSPLPASTTPVAPTSGLPATPSLLFPYGSSNPHPLRPPPPPTRSLQSLDAGPWARAALHAELGRIHVSVPGSRNHILNRGRLQPRAAGGRRPPRRRRRPGRPRRRRALLRPQPPGGRGHGRQRPAGRLQPPPPSTTQEPVPSNGEEIRSFPHHRDERRTLGQMERHGP